MMGFCSFDYESYQFNEGSTIIKEQLHQYAIFNQKGAEKWLEYMNRFDDYCISDWENIASCTAGIQKEMNMSDTYMVNPEETLRLWSVQQSQIGFDTFPEVAINNMIYRGNFDGDEIIEAFCLSLTAPPAYCIQDNSNEQSSSTTGNGHVAVIITVTIVSLLVVILLVVCIYRRFIRKELTTDMSSRVGELVAHYANKVSKQKIRQQEKFIEAHD
jgi:hypothetical protein